MDIAKLKVFAQVAEHGSLTRAAVTLGATPSALSRQITALEAECGAQLFLRTGRGLKLTELGGRVLPRLQDLFARIDELAEELRARPAAASGEVRLGLLTSLPHTLAGHLYKQVSARHPGIRLSFVQGTSGQLDEWLEKGGVDMAVLYRDDDTPRAGWQRLAVLDSYLVGPAGDALTAAQTVKFARLDKLPLVLPGAPNAFRIVLENLARRHGLMLNVVMEANNPSIVRDVVAGGDAYTVITWHAMAADLKAGRLQAAKIVEPGIDRYLTLGFARQRSPSPATREVARLIRGIVDWPQLRSHPGPLARAARPGTRADSRRVTQRRRAAPKAQPRNSR